MKKNYMTGNRVVALVEELKKISRLIECVDYIIAGDSICDAAEKLGFTNATVSNWINKEDGLKVIDPVRYVKVRIILNNSIPKSINDYDIIIRVISAGNYILLGYTTEWIANYFGVSINVIYEDLQTRLPKIDGELAIRVKLKLCFNSLDNMSLGENNFSGQERDKYGRFK